MPLFVYKRIDIISKGRNCFHISFFYKCIIPYNIACVVYLENDFFNPKTYVIMWNTYFPRYYIIDINYKKKPLCSYVMLTQNSRWKKNNFNGKNKRKETC